MFKELDILPCLLYLQAQLLYSSLNQTQQLIGVTKAELLPTEILVFCALKREPIKSVRPTTVVSWYFAPVKWANSGQRSTKKSISLFR